MANPPDSAVGNKARWEKAVLRRELRLGKITLTDILLDTPECVQSTPTILVIDLVKGVGSSAIAELNYQAMQDKINLCLPVGALTERAKTFLIQWDCKRRKVPFTAEQKKAKELKDWIKDKNGPSA